MINSIRLLILLSLTILFISGEVTSPTEARGGFSSLEIKSVFLDPIIKPQRTLRTIITGFSSSRDETGDNPWNPWITASGVRVHSGTAASNFLPFGTKIRIPSLFGDRIFVIEDRLHNRFYDRIDIWFPSKTAAKEFGIRYDVPVEILK